VKPVKATISFVPVDRADRTRDRAHARLDAVAVRMRRFHDPLWPDEDDSAAPDRPQSAGRTHDQHRPDLAAGMHEL
jgi:hypothetical protein